VSVIIKGKNPRRPHTVRYWHDGRQRERSFATAKEAKDFKIKADHDTRAQIFIDDKLGREDFGTAVDTWIDRHAVVDSTRNGYRATARAWVKPAFPGRTVAQVANDRDRVTDLLVKDIGHLSVTSAVRRARSSRAPSRRQSRPGNSQSTIFTISNCWTTGLRTAVKISCSRRTRRWLNWRIESASRYGLCAGAGCASAQRSACIKRNSATGARRCG
jgi:hypothetical protein